MLDRILIGSSAEPTDPNFKNVTLLLHGDGSNGAQNNTFIDSSTNNFTITRNGNTTQGSFSPYGSNWSNYFDGSGDYLTVPANTAFAFGTGDFTVEFWFNAASYRTSGPYYDCFLALGNFANSPYFRINQDGRLTAGITASNEYYSTSTVTLNQWTHFAVTRQGSTVRIFVNGSLQTTQTNSTNLLNTTDVTVGTSAWQAANETFTGYLSNVRVLKGTALYTSTFTPSTTPLTAITNTSLLTCQSNRFRDASTNNFTITRNGDVKVTNFAPFAPSFAYSASTNGGSAYFDGTGDYLTSTSANTANAMGTGDWTVEGWVYRTSGAADMVIFDTVGISATAADYIRIFINTGGGVSFFKYSTATTTTSSAMPIGAWSHFAVVRESGSIKIYVNGVQGNTTYTDTGSNYTCSTSRPAIGINGYDAAANAYAGYVSNIRAVKGTAVYTANFTPPTSPVTAITNTSLLLNATNAAIFDNSMKNDLETVGNAQISTSVKKFGTGSMAFDGSGDGLKIIPDAMYNFSGDFTVEFWAYAATVDANEHITIQAWNTANGWLANMNGSKFNFNFKGSQASGTTTVSSGQWYHVAATRSGSTIRLFVNGTQEGTATNSTAANMGTLPMYIGAGQDGTGQFWNGYIDDLRVTSGLARYTANFTAPTAPFPNK